jgi:hypothetical protein
MDEGGDHRMFVSPVEVDSHLASELHNMSMEARSTLLEEIHGVTSEPPEEGSHERMEECLRRMAQELRNIPEKRAYDEASNNATSFVNVESYRLSFLRAERFDPRKAAARMALQLKLLSQHFGPEALQRRITFHDLTEEAQMVVKSGNLQMLPSRDRSGRKLMMRIGTLGSGLSCHTRVRWGGRAMCW